MTIGAFWDTAPCSLGVDRRFRCAYCLIVLMMEVVSTSEKSVYYNETTWRSIPEGSNLHVMCLVHHFFSNKV
jgi:hypothetical protein